MNEIRQKMLGLIINSDMTEPPLRESYLRYTALETKYGQQALRDALLEVMRLGDFDITRPREEPNGLQFYLKKKLAEVVNYDNEFRFAEKFLSNIFALQQRENIEVEVFLPFVAAGIKSKGTPRAIWHDVLLYSKDKLAGNPACIAEFLGVFHRLVPDDMRSHVVDWSPDVNTFSVFNIENNHEMHRFAYTAFKVREELPIVRASTYAWLNGHHSKMIMDKLKEICQERKVTPKQLFDAVLAVSRLTNEKVESEHDKWLDLYKLLDNGFGDLHFQAPELKPNWFDETMIEFFNMATTWSHFKSKGM